MASQRIAFIASGGCKVSRNTAGLRLSPTAASSKELLESEKWQHYDRRWKATEAPAQVGKPVRRIDPLDLSFMNHEAAFKSKSTWEVFRGLVVYQLCSIGPLVENNEKLMKFGKAVLGESLFAKLMKMSFYGHFVAGENRQAIKPVIHRMHSFGVKSILDYSVEEDISEQEASNREMDGCAPSSAEDACVNPTAIKDLGTHEDKIKKYHAHKQFGDRRKNVSSARTYFYQNEAQCEKNMETFLRCIEAVADSTGATGMAAIKVTALGRPNLLLQLSETIMRTQRYFKEVSGEKVDNVLEANISKDSFVNRFKKEDFEQEPELQEWLSGMTHDQKGLIHLFSWSGLIDSKLLLKDVFKVPNLKTGKMEPLISALTEREEEQFRNMLNRLNVIFTAATEMDVRVMIDAEQSYFQPAIHRLAMEMMKKYNQDKAIVFNTYQCYLKSAYKTLMLDLEQASRQNFFFGAKLVRGAYMEQERERAANLGYEDPINPDYEATSEMYHRCLEECMKRMSELKKQGNQMEKRIGIMVASHNADTIRFTIAKMKELGIKGDERLICFGQLLGMCDNLTFPLGQAGYSVYKYVPYGPVNEVLPYLSRRARENKGILEKLEVEKSLLRAEMKDRILKGRLGYTPRGEYLPVGFESLPVLK